MVEGLTERREGRSRRSFPKRQGWVGYLEDIFPPRVKAYPSTIRAASPSKAGSCGQLWGNKGWGALPRWLITTAGAGAKQLKKWAELRLMDQLLSVSPGVNVAVESELCLILQGSDSAGIPETSYLCVTLGRYWRKTVAFQPLCYIIQSHEMMVLTSFEGDNAFQTGKFSGIQPHLSESGDHLLEGLDLWHDLRHPLRLCVFSVHSCDKRQSKCHLAGCAYIFFFFLDCSASLLHTRNSKKSGGVHRNGPLCNA